MPDKLTSLHLDHDSYISLHVQLHNLLRQRIVSGAWQQGDRIPGEVQLAKHLKISRTTVRIALQSAEVEGLVERIPGRGTFVSYTREDRHHSRFIGYVTRNFHNNIHRVLLSSAETELRSAGYRVIFSNATDSEGEVNALLQLLDENVAGLILWPNAYPTPAQREVLDQYIARGVPVVFVDRFVDGIDADYIASDNYGGTYALVQHLVELGHERIAYLRTNITNLFPVDERQRGYEAAMTHFGLTAYKPLRINSPQQQVFLEADIHELLAGSSAGLTAQIIDLLRQLNPMPTAIACVNDALAIITMRALSQMGLGVPDDVSVVGFDDVSLAAYMQVPLTTTRQNAHAIGTGAAKLLLHRIDSATAPASREVIPTHVQIRSSTTTPIAIHLSSERKRSPNT